MLSDTTLKQTPLHNKHTELNAKIVPFSGWEMPLQYEGILAEYEDTRQRVSVFDTSHMGEFFVEGDPAVNGFDKIVTQTLKDMPHKTCRYGVMLNDQAGIIDDLIVYRIDQERWMIVVNAGTMEKDAKQFASHITNQGTFDNQSHALGKLDIQGPQSRDLLADLVVGLEKLAYYTFDEFEVLGEKVIVSRTGYTGELGYEIYFPWDRTSELWEEILKRGAKPAGLGVRDVLRVEMGYSLYGHELEEHINPLEAGLSKFIDWEKDFVGKSALAQKKEQGIERKIFCFISETRRSPRAEHKIFSQDEEEIGVVTSGTFSPSQQRGIGLGFIRKDKTARGDRILIGKDKNTIKAEISGRPIYKTGSLKN